MSKEVKMSVYTVSLIVGVDRQWTHYKDAYEYLERICSVWKANKVIIGYRITNIHKHKGKTDFLKIDKDALK